MNRGSILITWILAIVWPHVVIADDRHPNYL